MARLIAGIATNSGGKHKVSNGGVRNRAYITWRHMIERCYCNNYQKNRPTYIGCTVTEEWLEYQVFAEWFCSQSFADMGYDLDKDLLILGNKIYSPETCVFIPRQINSLLTDRRLDRGCLPIGVTMDNRKEDVYQARVCIDGKRKHLGLFNCPNEAHLAYKRAKEENVQRMALEWKDRIAENVFEALMNWTVVNDLEQTV